MLVEKTLQWLQTTTAIINTAYVLFFDSQSFGSEICNARVEDVDVAVEMATSLGMPTILLKGAYRFRYLS